MADPILIDFGDNNPDNTEIRAAARCVALDWRDAMSSGNAPDVIADRLHRSLERLLAVFERHTARQLEELAASRKADALTVAVDREHRRVPEPPSVTRRRRIERVETKEDLL